LPLNTYTRFDKHLLTSVSIVCTSYNTCTAQLTLCTDIRLIHVFSYGDDSQAHEMECSL